jgi:ferredoxin-nitrite reductase
MSDADAWALALKRNSRERLKKEKLPLQVIHELPRLIERGYEDVSEDDLVRLQWYGLYHDKPKIGTFMLRVKIPNGILTPAKLRIIGLLSERFGQGYGEITTRQDIQLHSIRLEHLPGIFRTLQENGLTTAGACGDVVRNITGCPVAGIDTQELFDVRPIVGRLADFLDGNPEYADLPRKHKITVAACPGQCNLPEIHCQAYVALVHGGRRGFAVRVGGGLSSVPRIARPLGVFVPEGRVVDVARAILDVWKTDPTYRRSFAKARLKFMVDDLGVEELRRRVETRLGERLETLADNPAAAEENNHLGVHEQKQPGLHYIGFPVLAGRISGAQMIQLAEWMEQQNGEIRLTQQQNLLLTHLPTEAIDALLHRAANLGLTLDHRLRGTSVACTGQPFCSFAVTDTKGHLIEIVTHLERVFGAEVKDLRIFLDGCPHACGHHWVGDIGLMGTTSRTELGTKVEAYDIILHGSRGKGAAVGRPIARRIPTSQLRFALERLVRAFRTEAEGTDLNFHQFCQQHTDAELQAILAGGAGGSGEPPYKAQ